MLMKAMHCSNLGLCGRAPARGTGTHFARLEVATSIRRVHRCPPARFQTEKHLGWAPAKETFDEKDRQKAVQISMRFDDADRNKDGRIDLDELRALLETTCSDSVESHLIQHWLSEEEVARVMSQYDLDRSGDLDRNEFEQLVADGLLLDEKLADYKAAFDAVDTDGSGDINADELRVLLTRLGWDPNTNTETVLNLMGKYDLNENGRLDFNEFMRLMKAHMLDVSEVLAYVGARPSSPTTARNVVNAVSHRDFLMVMSEEDLDGALQRNSGRLVVLFAGATWCGSSRATVTMVKSLADAYPKVVFLMLWGNINDATKKLFRDRLKVRSTPAFFMFKDGDLVNSFAGAQAGKLEAEVRKRLAPEELPPVGVYTMAMQPFE